MGPLISIITVSYNSEDTIEKTIESVGNQTYKNLEYIFVDGMSTDKTMDIIQEKIVWLENKGIKCKVICEKDGGVYDAMNKGIRLASGELIGILNSDDWYEKDAVEHVAGIYMESGFDYYYANINIIKGNKIVRVKHSKYMKIVTSRNWNHPSSFVAKKLYGKIGLYSCKGIHDDFDLFLRAIKSNSKIIVDDKIIANFRIGGISNARSLKKSYTRCKDRYECYIRNGFSRVYIFECIVMELAKIIML